MYALCSQWVIGDGLYLYVDGVQEGYTANASNPSIPTQLVSKTADAHHADSPLTLGWKRALAPAEIELLSRNPWQIFRQLTPRLYFFVSSGADLTVDIDTPGSVTIEGQEVAVSLGVDLEAGAIDIAGQSVTAALGVNLDEAGAILIEGQDATIQVGADLTVTIDTPGSVTIQGQAATIALGVDLAVAGAFSIEGLEATVGIGLNVDEAGSILIGGEEVSAVVSGDLDIPIDTAGSITIEGQECSITLTQTAPEVGGRGRPRQLRRRVAAPQPIAQIDILFRQPPQDWQATVEVSDGLDLEEFEQNADALELSFEVSSTVELGFDQEEQAFEAFMHSLELRGPQPPVQTKPNVYRLLLEFEQGDNFELEIA